MQHQKILILDFGSQVTQLIARRVREAHVYCEVHPCDVSSDWVREFAADGLLKGVILSGSHASVYEVDDKAPDAVFDAFCNSRITGAWGHVFGSLGSDADLGAIIARAQPV